MNEDASDDPALVLNPTLRAGGDPFKPAMHGAARRTEVGRRSRRGPPTVDRVLSPVRARPRRRCAFGPWVAWRVRSRQPPSLLIETLACSPVTATSTAPRARAAWARWERGAAACIRCGPCASGAGAFLEDHNGQDARHAGGVGHRQVGRPNRRGTPRQDRPGRRLHKRCGEGGEDAQETSGRPGLRVVGSLAGWTQGAGVDPAFLPRDAGLLPRDPGGLPSIPRSPASRRRAAASRPRRPALDTEESCLGSEDSCLLREQSCWVTEHGRRQVGP